MAYEQRDNSGSLFKNDRKEKETHPDYKGDAMVNGQMVWMSAWLKTASNGSKFMSFSFTPKEQQAAKKPVAREIVDFVDDDMPF
ncbi:MAG TPA: hypothetical protein VLA24_14580 [Pseudomonadales bacterium]|nr:hypothetical protein [Pseudomonadales bacterium]